ncbi:MAG: nucleotide sugar dehydrogenase [Candidatus Micrarchaeota archaeon]|nr:nucleotide sugar dehydrogenase [Candidatus Micrarchaeota archaeon]
MKISVTGLGNAGLPLAAVIADAGIEVYGIDTDARKVEMINSGKNPIPEEAGLSELISKYGGKRLKATTDAAEGVGNTEVHIILVPLWLDEKKVPDFSMVKGALESVGKHMKKGDLVVLETTVPVGTTDGLARETLEKASGLKAGKDFYLACSPERIMTGVAISRFRDFPKIVGGIDRKSGEMALGVYRKFVKNIEMVSNSRTAEMVKISEGIYRDVNIALANELYLACQEYGIDFSEMRKYANHQYCHIHEPGVGVGGHCIPIYPWFLIRGLEGLGKGGEVELVREARGINDGMADYWAERIAKVAAKRKVCVTAISYRPGVKKTFYSRPLALIKIMEKKGMDVSAYDALYSKEEIERMGLRYAKPEECDIIFDPFALTIRKK